MVIPPRRVRSSPEARLWHRVILLVVGLFVLFGSAPPVPAGDTAYESVRGVSLRDCDDALTCRFDLPGGPPVVTRNVPVKLAGLEAPDVNGACDRERERAREARRVLLAWLTAADTIVLRKPQRGESFHLTAGVLADGRDVAERLIREGLVRPAGAEPTSWCRSQPDRTSSTGTPVGDAAVDVVIREVDPGAERVLVENRGATEVDMGGWTLVHGPSGRRYVFPGDYRLAPGAGTIVTSGPGAVNAPPYFLRWTGNELWEDASDTAHLLDADGERVSRWPR